jgi:hypothetical protein
LETAAARVPFSNFFFSPLMTEEDIVNLRTFQRLMLLLSGARRKEDFNIVSFVVYTKTISLHCYIFLSLLIDFSFRARKYGTYMITVLVNIYYTETNFYPKQGKNPKTVSN